MPTRYRTCLPPAMPLRRRAPNNPQQPRSDENQRPLTPSTPSKPTPTYDKCLQTLQNMRVYGRKLARSASAINDPETAEYVSRRCGATTVEVNQLSRWTQSSGSSRTRSKQLVSRRLILPHEAWHARRRTVFTAGNAPLRCGRAIWFRRADMKACVKPNASFMLTRRGSAASVLGSVLVLWNFLQKSVIDFEQHICDRLTQSIAGRADVILRSVTRGLGKLKALLADNLLGNFNRPEAEVATAPDLNSFFHAKTSNVFSAPKTSARLLTGVFIIVVNRSRRIDSQVPLDCDPAFASPI